MSLAQYTDLAGENFTPAASPGSAARTTPRIVPMPGKTNYQGQVRPIKLVLEEAMFTGRVPLSTWTFVFGVRNKLWISQLTTLYFGKRLALNKTLYQGKLYVPDRRLDLPVTITAYNGYGDLLQADKLLRGYAPGPGNNGTQLITLEQDWMQLMFRFRVQVG